MCRIRLLSLMGMRGIQGNNIILSSLLVKSKFGTCACGSMIRQRWHRYVASHPITTFDRVMDGEYNVPSERDQQQHPPLLFNTRLLD